MELSQFNSVACDDELFSLLHQVCASSRWCRQMMQARPFASIDDVQKTASRIWWGLTPSDWLEGFAGHPRIGYICI